VGYFWDTLYDSPILVVIIENWHLWF